MENESLVSVIMPTYNGEKTIQRAIKSVLNQSYKNLEVIVVDDCSQDNTVMVVNSIKDRRIKLIRHNENRNGSAARNTGIKESRGKYIAFLDDDDEWLKEKISKQIKYLKSKNSKEWKACIPSHRILSNRKWREVILKKEGDIRREIFMMEMSLGAGSSLLIDKEIIKEIGLFNEEYIRHQDMEYILRYLMKYKLGVMSEVLTLIHGHSGNVSGEKMATVKKKFLKDFKREIDSFGRRLSRRIYARQWLQVSKHYALDGDVLNTFRYLFKSLSFALLFSNRYRFLILENYIALPYHLLKSILKK